MRDAYGVSAGSFNGYVDLQNTNPLTSYPLKSGGLLNISPGTYTTNLAKTSATVTTYLTNSTGTGNVLQITQVFSFLGPGNVLQDKVTLTNVTSAALMGSDGLSGVGAQDLVGVQFRRVDSLFVNGGSLYSSGSGQPNNAVTVDPLANPVTMAAPYSFVPASPSLPLGDTESPNPAYPLVDTTNGGTVNDSGDFLGGAFNLSVGTLYTNPLSGPTSSTFNIYFAEGIDANPTTNPATLGQSEASLRAELNGLGVNYIISDNYTGSGGPFVVAIGTQVVPGTPEPTTLALLGLGLAGLAGARWRRARLK